MDVGERLAGQALCAISSWDEGSETHGAFYFRGAGARNRIDSGIVMVLVRPMQDELSQDVLDEIRRAAFDLRRTDAQEAVRVLRKAAAQGGPAEVLARGALGEIYLEEFGDLDGAEAEFRKVLAAAPGLPAAELGLARVQRESGRKAQADAGLLRALRGLEHDVATFRESRPPAGAEEVVLTLLEVAVELAELRGEGATVPLDEYLLEWAASQRLFDSEEAGETGDAQQPDQDDWVRFHSLWSELRVRTGRAQEAASALAQAEASEELPHADAARLRSHALESAGDREGAAEQARALFAEWRTASQPFAPLEALRAAALYIATGDEPAAASLLEETLAQVEARLAGSPAQLDVAEKTELEADAQRLRDALAPAPEPAPDGLVRIGLGKR